MNENELGTFQKHTTVDLRARAFAEDLVDLCNHTNGCVLNPIMNEAHHLGWIEVEHLCSAHCKGGHLNMIIPFSLIYSHRDLLMNLVYQAVNIEHLEWDARSAAAEDADGE